MNCTNGHDSATADYCDQCGVKIDGAAVSVTPAAPTTAPPAAPAPSDVASPTTMSPKASGFDVATTPGTCPNCHGPKDGFSIFCEDCGYDFVTGIVPANRGGAPSPVATPSASTPTLGTVVNQAGLWMIIVATDRAQFDRVGDATVVFPVGVPDRVVELNLDRALIGRKSTSRNIHPEVDLSHAPEDVAVSRQHAEILRGADGSFTVTDLGSSNGTFLNGSAAAMSPNTAMALNNGDSVSVGAWTTLTLVLP